MTLTLEVVPYGPDAAGRLATHVHRSQGDDRLAPVTVVVSRATVGLALRRQLAAGPTGLVNVSFVTLGQLAESWGGDALAARGRGPASPAVVHAAVRASLADATGPLRAARLHPATERAIAAVVRDLQGCEPATLGRMARLGPRPAAVARVVAEVQRRLADWYDPAEVAEQARRDVEAAAQVAPVLVHLPTAVAPHHRRLLAALAGRAPVVVLLGATGDPAADEPTLQLAAELDSGAAAGLRWPSRAEAPAALVRSAPTADVEVLLAARGVMERLRLGVPLERMAVVSSGLDPYPRVIQETFEQAGIPTNGAGVRRLAATAAGRTLLGALALPDHGWRRDEVVAWFSGTPIRLDGASGVPAARWDRLTSDAGIVAGYDQWLEHLDGRTAELARRIEEVDADDDPTRREDADRRQERRRGELAEVAEIRAFVVELADRIDPPSPPRTWLGWSRWADQLLRRYLQPDPSWPLDERQALDEVFDVVARLSGLDPVEPEPDQRALRRAVETELDAPAPSTARFGHGVLIGSVEAVVGLDLDAVFVVGMTEGAFPAGVREDALLPDDERQAASPDLPRRGDRVPQARRAYLAALACGRERVLSYARGDLRRGREQRPSPWLLESLSARVGRRLFSREVSELEPVAGFDWVPSLTAAVRSSLEPASEADRDLRSLLRWFDRHHQLDGHPLTTTDPVLRAGLRARHERRAGDFTRFDGLVHGLETPIGGRAVAPTSLEHYAACPRRYFFSDVLWLRADPRPEDVVRISRMDWGNVVHRVLERFIDEHVQLPRADRIQPGQHWSDEHRARLDEIADEVFAEFEQRGLTGRELLWDLDRRAIRRDLHAFLDADDQYRATQGVVPERAELHFRPDDGTPVDLRLGDGRRLQFKGSADRVDQGHDGSLVVLDYKTGKSEDFQPIARQSDPTLRGTKLQLPIYGLAAQSRLGEGPVRAAYWFVSAREAFTQIAYPSGPEAGQRFRDAVTAIVDGIEAGAFPGRPGDEDTRFGRTWDNCKYCDFDAICPTDRDRAWDRVRPAPELAGYAALAEGEAAP